MSNMSDEKHYELLNKQVETEVLGY